MTTKLKIILAVIAVVAFALGAVAFAPARLLEGPARAALAPHGDLTNTVGTVWSGSGVLVLGKQAGGRGAGVSGVNVPIAWQFVPISLFKLRLGFDVLAKSDAISGVARAGIGFRNIDISGVDIKADASFISALNNLIAFAGPRGTLQLKTNVGESVTFAYRGPISVGGKLNAQADNLALRTLFAQPVGSYEVNINFRDNLAEYSFVKSSGLLALDGGGQVQWLPRREFAYNGTAKASAQAPLLFAAMLPLGGPTLDGRVRIDYKGAW
jgi:Type II secretion system (T2SS), protein N